MNKKMIQIAGLAGLMAVCGGLIQAAGLTGREVMTRVENRDDERKHVDFTYNFLERRTFELPYLEKDFTNFSGKLLRLPNREEVPIEVNEILVIELYSK